MKFYLFLYCSASFLFINSKAQQIDYQVPGKVPAIKQPKTNDCWITVTTMMYSWRDTRSYSIEEVAEMLGEPWKSRFRNNKGLTFEEQDEFIISANLAGEPPANYILEFYLDLLIESGPLWITTGNGFIAHAKVLIGMKGDGSYEATDFIFIDPATGKVVIQNALEFVLEFEKEAIVANEDNWERFRIQIYHF